MCIHVLFELRERHTLYDRVTALCKQSHCMLIIDVYIAYHWCLVMSISVFLLIKRERETYTV